MDTDTGGAGDAGDGRLLDESGEVESLCGEPMDVMVYPPLCRQTGDHVYGAVTFHKLSSVAGWDHEPRCIMCGAPKPREGRTE